VTLRSRGEADYPIAARRALAAVRALRALGIAPRAVAELEAAALALLADANLPSQFTGRHLSRGWIAHSRMPVPVMEQANRAFDQGNVGLADDILAAAVTAEELYNLASWMETWPRFRPRAGLLRLAAEDYLNGRYHASVPVTLAQLEGWGRDMGITDAYRAKDAQRFVVPGEPITDALPVLLRAFGDSKVPPVDQPMDIPLRHVILHGASVTFGTRLIAAKSWTALFAIRTYASVWVRRNTEAAWEPRR
jgi:hypothetical protein